MDISGKKNSTYSLTPREGWGGGFGAFPSAAAGCTYYRKVICDEGRKEGGYRRPCLLAYQDNHHHLKKKEEEGGEVQKNVCSITLIPPPTFHPKRGTLLLLLLLLPSFFFIRRKRAKTYGAEKEAKKRKQDFFSSFQRKTRTFQKEKVKVLPLLLLLFPSLLPKRGSLNPFLLLSSSGKRLLLPSFQRAAKPMPPPPPPPSSYTYVRVRRRRRRRRNQKPRKALFSPLPSPARPPALLSSRVGLFPDE